MMKSNVVATQINPPSFFTLLMMISFASVNAVLFTPALPGIATFFSISIDSAQQTITWFLIGYALGQLFYGPIANRYGRKPALYFGIGLQIISSVMCVFSGMIHQYLFLIMGRFLLALGSGVGLKMTFTLVNECYEPKIASQKIAYLMLAFAITPAVAVALGGILNDHYGWKSCFYAGAIYGVILLLFVMRLSETKLILDYHALKLKNLFQGYSEQFKNVSLISGGFLMGGATSFVYVFAALAPFVAINILGMSSVEYGFANLLPAIGLIIGSLFSAQFSKKIPLRKMIKIGILIVSSGALLMMFFAYLKLPALYLLFLPMIFIYFGAAFIMANASVVAMSHVQDKSHGAAVMSFVNMGAATLAVLLLGLFPVGIILLPVIYLCLCIAMIGIYTFTHDA